MHKVEVVFLDETQVSLGYVAEDIKAEAEEYQIFYTGSATDSALAVTVTDRESDYGKNVVGEDLPVGLESSWNATPGTGIVTVRLQHLHPINSQPQKLSGISYTAGDTDIAVSFEVIVQ